MSFSVTRRSFLNASGQAVAAAVATQFVVLESRAQEAKSKYADCFKPLDTFIEQYMRDMNSPGMTVVLADRDGVQRLDLRLRRRGSAKAQPRCSAVYP